MATVATAADPKPAEQPTGFQTVEECTAAARAAIEAADSLIGNQRKELDAVTSENQFIRNQVDLARTEAQTLRDQKNAWYRDPYIVGSAFFILGAVVGIRAIRAAQ